jgi:uncharacterized membrane protein YkoI
MLNKPTRILLAAATAAALTGGGVAIASGGDDDATDTAISGSALDRASQAALDHMGGGKVTGTEVGDEESYYEVEVTLDGAQTDVQLDRAFKVVSTKTDGKAGKDD